MVAPVLEQAVVATVCEPLSSKEATRTPSEGGGEFGIRRKTFVQPPPPAGGGGGAGRGGGGGGGGGGRCAAGGVGESAEPDKQRGG
jgi:hypothetical protein